MNKKIAYLISGRVRGRYVADYFRSILYSNATSGWLHYFAPNMLHKIDPDMLLQMHLKL